MEVLKGESNLTDHASKHSVTGALCRLRSSSCSVWERCEGVLLSQKQQLRRRRVLQQRQEAPVAAAKGDAGAIQDPGSISCSVQELQEIQERRGSVAGASGSVAGAWWRTQSSIAASRSVAVAWT